MKRLPRMMVALLLALALGCGGSDDTGSDASNNSGNDATSNTSNDTTTTPGNNGGCQVTTLCYEYSGSSYSPAAAQQACTALSGTYSASGCPSANRVGYCTSNSGTANEIKQHYYSPYPAATAKQGCEAQSPPGVWTAN